MQFNLIIEGHDYSRYCGRYDFVEVPRRIVGPNEGTAINGDLITDYITTKYDAVWAVGPMDGTALQQLMADLAKETVSMTFISRVTGASVTKTMVPNVSELPIALKDSYKTIYHGITVNFTAV